MGKRSRAAAVLLVKSTRLKTLILCGLTLMLVAESTANLLWCGVDSWGGRRPSLGG
jgi:hypothetical protein